MVLINKIFYGIDGFVFVYNYVDIKKLMKYI